MPLAHLEEYSPMPVAEGRRHKAHRPGLLAEHLAGGRQGALLHHVLGVKVHLAAVLGHHLIWLDSGSDVQQQLRTFYPDVSRNYSQY